MKLLLHSKGLLSMDCINSKHLLLFKRTNKFELQEKNKY